MYPPTVLSPLTISMGSAVSIMSFECRLTVTSPLFIGNLSSIHLPALSVKTSARRSRVPRLSSREISSTITPSSWLTYERTLSREDSRASVPSIVSSIPLSDLACSAIITPAAEASRSIVTATTAKGIFPLLSPFIGTSEG